MSKWIVVSNYEFYPSVSEFDSYEEAKEDYDKSLKYQVEDEIIYIAEVFKKAGD